MRLSSKFDGTTKYAHWDYIKVEKTPIPNAAPVVSNVTASQRTDGSKIVDIYYDLYDANAELCDITFKLSANDGASYDIIPSPANLSGDFGDDLPSGTNKHIIWNAVAESYGLDGSYLYRVYADDGSSPPMPESFVPVAGGTFNNGTSDVTISSFYIDKYELTQADYQAVIGVNPSSSYGVGDNYPVYYVSWFNAIEYCNRRSIQEGLTPCYSYSSYGTNPANWPGGWNSTSSNHTNVSCNWTANGYRLPTEMEWQFAARGGNQTHIYTYSGSNDLNAVGWYNSNSGDTTHSCGTKAANELGTFDMSGNVWEWVWDIYGSYPSGSQTNPTGANSGSDRVRRGGSWHNYADYCTVSYRNYDDATYSSPDIGFRCVRVSP
ncbi:MAG: transcriptional regulator [Candidatus Cloacimonetes bacterium HGW-Cloacimonetes-2]|nr:MAG: transcriptional regulator [Candidatus Cloacimonetes bacterium HGW-Cloacimonetes-2]